MTADEHRNQLWRWVGPAIRRVRIQSYRSIGQCDLTLSPLTVVVGRNGAGKSNLLDALAFVADAVRGSLAEAVRFRGGLDAVRRRSTGHPRIVRFELEIRLPSWHLARYGFALETRTDGGFTIRDEQAAVYNDSERLVAHFQRDADTVLRASLTPLPPPVPDRLYLTRAAGFDEFRELYDALATMVAYRFAPERMKIPRPPGERGVLDADGANLASVVGRLGRESPSDLARIGAYLGAIAPGILGVERINLGPFEALQVRRTVAGAQHPWKFYAADLADGTLRALGLLVAAFQDTRRSGRVGLIAVEEPEAGLHPAASAVLVEALREASQHTQVLLTSHSPDLVDQLRPGKDTLLVAIDRQGTSELAPAAGGKGSWGERLRGDTLRPAREAPSAQDQLDLFAPPAADPR